MTLAVGEHVRMPRTYRGRDILWWMDASGLLDERYERCRTWSGRALCRRCSSSAHRRGRSTSTRCAGSGCGWWAGSPASGTAGRSSPGRCPTCARWPISSWAGCWTPSTGGRTRPASTRTRRRGSRRPRYRCPRFPRRCARRDRDDRVGDRLPPGPAVAGRRACSTEGAGSCTTAGSRRAPACIVIGLPFLRRRKSTLIDGAGPDARELADHLVGYLDTIARRPLVGRRAS